MKVLIGTSHIHTHMDTYLYVHMYVFLYRFRLLLFDVFAHKINQINYKLLPASHPTGQPPCLDMKYAK